MTDDPYAVSPAAPEPAAASISTAPLAWPPVDAPLMDPVPPELPPGATPVVIAADLASRRYVVLALPLLGLLTAFRLANGLDRLSAMTSPAMVGATVAAFAFGVHLAVARTGGPLAVAGTDWVARRGPWARRWQVTRLTDVRSYRVVQGRAKRRPRSTCVRLRTDSAPDQLFMFGTVGLPLAWSEALVGNLEARGLREDPTMRGRTDRAAATLGVAVPVLLIFAPTVVVLADANATGSLTSGSSQASCPAVSRASKEQPMPAPADPLPSAVDVHGARWPAFGHDGTAPYTIEDYLDESSVPATRRAQLTADGFVAVYRDGYHPVPDLPGTGDVTVTRLRFATPEGARSYVAGVNTSICSRWTGHRFAAAPGGMAFGRQPDDRFVRFNAGPWAYDVEIGNFSHGSPNGIADVEAVATGLATELAANPADGSTGT